MKKLALAAVAAAALFAATSSFAQAPEGYTLYAEGNMGHSVVENAVGPKTRIAVGLTAGMQLAPRVAVEVSLQDLGRRGDGALTEKARATSVAVVGELPYSERISFLGKAGLAHTEITSSASDMSKTSALVGAGVAYHLDKRAALRGMVTVYPDFAGSSESLTQVSLGLKYAF